MSFTVVWANDAAKLAFARLMDEVHDLLLDEEQHRQRIDQLLERAQGLYQRHTQFQRSWGGGNGERPAERMSEVRLGATRRG